MADIVKRLRSYKQADETGVMVLVSRQAVDEAADRIEVLEAEVNNAEANHILLSNLVQEQAKMIERLKPVTKQWIDCTTREHD